MLEKFFDGPVVEGDDDVAGLDGAELGANDGPLALEGIRHEADGLAGSLIKPAVVKPGMAIVQFGNQGHGSQIELAAILGLENGAEVLLVGGIELLLREAGEESADHLIDLRGRHDAVSERNGGGRLGAKEHSGWGCEEDDERNYGYFLEHGSAL